MLCVRPGVLKFERALSQQQRMINDDLPTLERHARNAISRRPSAVQWLFSNALLQIGRRISLEGTPINTAEMSGVAPSVAQISGLDSGVLISELSSAKPRTSSMYQPRESSVRHAPHLEYRRGPFVFLGQDDRLSPNRCAASSFSLNTADGRTLPRSVSPRSWRRHGGPACPS